MAKYSFFKVHVLAVSLPTQFHTMAWESSRGFPKVVGPCNYMGDPEDAPDPGFG